MLRTNEGEIKKEIIFNITVQNRVSSRRSPLLSFYVNLVNFKGFNSKRTTHQKRAILEMVKLDAVLYLPPGPRLQKPRRTNITAQEWTVYTLSNTDISFTLRLKFWLTYLSMMISSRLYFVFCFFFVIVRPFIFFFSLTALLLFLCWCTLFYACKFGVSFVLL